MSIHTYVRTQAHVQQCLSIPCFTASITLQHHSPAQPFIRDPPVDLTVNQSSPATFSCTAQGNPVPTISWTGPSANFTTEDTPGSNFTVSSVLTIDSAVRALHVGVYTCSASSGVGPSPSSSATLTVQGTAEDTPHNTRHSVDWLCLATYRRPFQYIFHFNSSFFTTITLSYSQFLLRLMSPHSKSCMW